MLDVRVSWAAGVSRKTCQVSQHQPRWTAEKRYTSSASDYHELILQDVVIIFATCLVRQKTGSLGFPCFGFCCALKGLQYFISYTVYWREINQYTVFMFLFKALRRPLDFCSRYSRRPKVNLGNSESFVVVERDETFFNFALFLLRGREPVEYGG